MLQDCRNGENNVESKQARKNEWRLDRDGRSRAPYFPDHFQSFRRAYHLRDRNRLGRLVIMCMGPRLPGCSCWADRIARRHVQLLLPLRNLVDRPN